jgi:hypothetical protein
MAEKKSGKANINFAGIRHHGPGTSKALKKWLSSFEPDLILLECPSDAKKKLDEIEPLELNPPFAIAIYSSNATEETILLPFAEFSPEWISIQYAKKNQIELIPIDLPSYAWNTEQNNKPFYGYGKNKLAKAFEAAGITDQEKWWDSSIEEMEEEAEIFSFIAELMENWRALDSDQNPLNELREAFMRTEIFRCSKKSKYKKIAVITGAYHTPALADFETKIFEDKKLVANLVKQKTQHILIPWSYQRLSSSTGYGAGVKYPSWYEHIYKYGFSASERWFTKAAEILRSRDFYVSTAEVIDCIELCRKLVALKGKKYPDLSDLKSAINSSVLHGKTEYWEIIEEELLIGRSFGDLGKLNEEHPIKKDFDAQIKKFRLSSLLKRKDRKSSKLDLRKESHLELSFFLHRLNLLGIYLGTVDYSAQSNYSNFSESWELEWSEDDEITLIQAGIYGNSIDEAVSNLTLEKLEKEKSLVSISEIMVKLLLAGMTKEVASCLKLLNRLAIESLDNAQLIPLCRQLLLGSKYGNIRNFSPEDLLSLLEDLIARVFGIFPSQCIHTDENKARQSLDDLTLLKNISGMLNKDDVNTLWKQLLVQLDVNEFIHALIKGASLRLLLDSKLISPNESTQRIAIALSGNKDPMEKSIWLEGLLSFGVLGLLYEREIVLLLENFVGSLTEEEFRQILPALKRSFSPISKNEKQRLFEKISSDVEDSEELYPLHKTSDLKVLNKEKIPSLVSIILN